MALSTVQKTQRAGNSKYQEKLGTESITPVGSVLISKKSSLALMAEAMWKTVCKVVQRGSQMQHLSLSQ